MKTNLFFTALMMITLSTVSMAQRGHHNNRQGDRNGDRNNDRRNDRHHTTYSYTSYGSNASYSNYSYYADRMSRRDRKKLYRLSRELRETERRAWSDGYLSRRDRRRIAEARADIDSLVSKYSRYDRNPRRGSYGSICR